MTANTVTLTREALQGLRSHHYVDCESGGMLGKNEDGVVVRVYTDRSAFTSKNEYKPSAQDLNDAARAWRSAGIRVAGFFHTHPNERRELSRPDLQFGRNFLERNPSFESLVMGLVLEDEVKMFRLDRDGGVIRCAIEEISDPV